MKLTMATLLNFNVNNKSTLFNNIFTSLHNDPGYKNLINQQKLLSKLLVLGHDNNKQQYYQKKYKHSVLLANLSFKNLNFRYKYLKWIYVHYSNSMANHVMVKRNEASALLQWANQFNQYYSHLKIIKIIPKINSNQFQANMLLIPFSINKNISFSLKDALIKEYHTSYNHSFYQFENDIGCILANIMHKIFIRCVPDADLHFINSIFNYGKLISKLKPLSYNKVSYKNTKYSTYMPIKININNKSLKRLSFHSHPLLNNNLKKYNASQFSNSYRSNLEQKSFSTNESTESIKYISNSNSKEFLLNNRPNHKLSSATYSKSSSSIDNAVKKSCSSLSKSAPSLASSYKSSQIPSRINIRHKKTLLSHSSKLKSLNLTLIIVISFLMGILFVILVQLFRL